MTFFSIIMPTFNREQYIIPSLNSVFAQEYRDYEIIVVDDGSTDSTLNLLAQLDDGSIKILSQKNAGPGAARNLAIQHSVGEYIIFLDSDDLFFPWTLSTYKLIIEKTNSKFIAGNIYNFFQDTDLKKVSRENFDYEIYLNYFLSAQDSIWIPTIAVAIEKNTLVESGCFSTKNINGEDSDLWLRLGTLNPFIFIKKPVLAGYRRHKESAVANNQKSYLGAMYMIEQENNGIYLGGLDLKQQRLDIITKHIRPISLACLKEGSFKNAWQLYRQSFLWNLSTRRIKYLIGFWILFCKNIIEVKIN